MDRLPKDVIWLMMTEYFNINDALNCLSISDIFWGRHTLEQCRLELLRFKLCRAQQAHFRLQQCKFEGNQGVARRCQYCGIGRGNGTHESKCKELYIPKEEPQCKWCECNYPTWKGSPHYRYDNCPLKPSVCEYYGLTIPPFFPHTCTTTGCHQFVGHHATRCKTRICAVCEEIVSSVTDHAGKGNRNNWCRALSAYFG